MRPIGTPVVMGAIMRKVPRGVEPPPPLPRLSVHAHNHTTSFLYSGFIQVV